MKLSEHAGEGTQNNVTTYVWQESRKFKREERPTSLRINSPKIL